MAGATQAAGSGALVERLQARRYEIEQTLLTRVYAVSDPGEVGDPEYVAGLRAAVSAALDYALAAIAGEADGEAVPAALLDQARAAARSGVNLDTVLRRYVAGYTLLFDCLMRESELGGSLEGPALRHVLRAQGILFDRLVVAVTTAYTTETESRLRTADHRRAERVKRLLEGELIETSELGYELEGWHLGVLAAGPRAPGAIRELAAALERRLLLVPPGGETIWAWLGGRQAVSEADLARLAKSAEARGVTIAIGEPGQGLGGWRLTHRQAKAAFPVALRGKARQVSYSEVAIVASVWGDDVLAGSLASLYLAPLRTERDGGAALRETLRAYFASGRNAASAASGLGVSRQTVNSRLHVIEEKVGRPLDTYGSEMETALRLWDLGHPMASTVD